MPDPVFVAPQYKLSGKITDGFNIPVAGVKVQAFDKTLRSKQLLGATPDAVAITDSSGFYQLSFPYLTLPGKEYKTPDVFIEVKDNNGVLLGQSAIHFNIGSEAVIDLQISAMDEFTHLVQIIKPLVEGAGITPPLHIKDLQEDNKHQDISFLASVTGIVTEKIAMLVRAHHLSDKYKINTPLNATSNRPTASNAIVVAPDFYYALLRSGFNIGLDALPNISASDLKNCFLQSIDDKIISASLTTSVEATAKGLGQLMAGHILKPDSVAAAKFKIAFAPAFPNAKLQQEFVEEYLNSGSTPAKFWSNLSQRPGFADGKAVAAAKRVLQISSFTGNQPELTATVYQDQQSDSEWKLKNLAAYTTDDWKRLIQKSGLTYFPENMEGTTNEEKITSYAVFLNNKVNESFPVEVFAQRLKKDNSPHWADVKEDLLLFLHKNPSFDLKTNSIKKQLGLANFDGIGNKELVQNELKAYNHLCKLSNDYEEIAALRKEKIVSAINLVSGYSRNTFVGTFAREMGAERAVLIFDRAKQVDNLATAFAIRIQQGFDTLPNVMRRRSGIPEDYRAWLGSGNLCDCDECQSVYSPAAYFTDIMRFLRDYGNPTEVDGISPGPAFVRLIEIPASPEGPARYRRPDLQNLQLTCQNFNTALPYIDLVNELLEIEVIRASEIADSEGITSPDHSYQTDGSADELAALPEHISSNAYVALAEVDDSFVLPAGLPIDLPLEEIRLYCNKLGFQRHELMESFYGLRPPWVYEDIPVATELLQFSPAEWRVINGEYTLRSIDSLPANVSELLQLTGINYLKLLQLLQCYFLNPVGEDNHRRLSVKQPEDLEEVTCDLNELFIAGMDASWINKLFRFLRLLGKLDWSLFELDRLLIAIGVTDFPASPEEFNTKILLPLSHARRLQLRLKLPVELVPLFFGDIDTRAYRNISEEDQQEQPSLYHKLFRNKSVTNPLDAAFGETGPDVNQNISDHIETVAAAFQISKSDLALLFETTDKLGLDTLSKIYRYILLARSLELSIAELQEVIALIGADPFDTADSSVLLKFLDQVDEIRSSNFEINELNYLLRHITNKTLPTPGDDKICSSLYQMREGLRKRKKENPDENFQENAPVIGADLLSSQMGIDSQIVYKLTTKMLTVPGDPDSKKIFLSLTSSEFVSSIIAQTPDTAFEIAESFPAVFSSWIKLYKTCYLLKKLQLQADDIDWLFANSENMGLSAVWELPVKQDHPIKVSDINNLFCLPELRKTNPDSTHKWYEVASGVISNNKKQVIELMAEIYAVPENLLVFLLGDKGNVNDPGYMQAEFGREYLKESFILSVLRNCRLMGRLGATPDQLNSLIIANVNTVDAQVARNLLKARYDSKEWLKVIKAISDVLRKKRRDGLLCYLKAKKPDVFPDNNAVFAWLLIDPEMDACMVTSRGQKAIGSVQLFVESCMMGLEARISLNKDFIQQWDEWRNRYALWGGNRMAFISPENWILPELLPNKSHFFQELESKLLQNEITNETAEKALKEYLEKLDEVANLDITCVYKETREEGEIIHLLACTNETPCKHFYRKKEDKIWNAWERVDLDIQGNHILMFVHNNQLQISWAIFQQKQVNSDTFIVPAAGGVIKSGQKYWEVKMAYSYYKNGRWTSKKLFKEALEWHTEEQFTVIRLANTPDFIQFKFYYSFGGCLIDGVPFFKDHDHVINTFPNTARIYSSGPTYLPDRGEPPVIDIFPNIQQVGGFLWMRSGYWCPLETRFFNMKIVEIDSSSNKLWAFRKGVIEFDLNSKAPEEESVQLLSKTPGEFSISPSQTETRMLSLDPFGYRDANGSFIVYPSASSPVEDADSNISTGDSIGSFWFESMYHPYSDKMRKILDRYGIDGLYDKELQKQMNDDLFSELNYGPQPIVSENYPVECFDFSLSGAYSVYNWELFFHIPFLIAKQLTNNQKFKEARKWYHYIFNPTRHASADEMDAERYWITRPFADELKKGIKTIDEIFADENVNELLEQVKAWETHPFLPHAVAAMRPEAYMRAIIMNYIDNLIALGDQLFRSNTLETINEATLLYVMAANMLGKKPEKVPASEQPGIRTFNSVADDLDAFSEVKIEIAANLPAVESTSGTEGDRQLLMPLFSIPQNKKLLAKWDTVADRLFKIRHCQNIGGQVQQLPLFEKIIDPDLLVRAAALGLDINSVLREIEMPLPNYRFQVMLQKANELCNDVKGLGNALLSVLEKKDAEELSLLRSKHELNILVAMKDIKKNQRDEAGQNLESLNKSREVIVFRKEYYSSRQFKNASEDQHLKSLENSLKKQERQAEYGILASVLCSFPNTTIGGWSWGVTYLLGEPAKALSSYYGYQSAKENTGGTKSSVTASYERRSDDWKFQAQSADLELKQLDKQILAAEIRLALAERDLEIHEQQIENAREVNDFMHDKYTNLQLYNWMLGQVSSVYFQSYQLAYDTAKKAEKCFQHELGEDNSNYVQFGNWDSLKKGLMSGEKLQYDLRRLENAYLEKNSRRFEITKHISLMNLNAKAVMDLRSSSECKFQLPELLFEMDYPGYYHLMIASVAISLPCVAGPYTSVCSQLTLDSSYIRKDDRNGSAFFDFNSLPDFNDSFVSYKKGNCKVNAIATSNGQGDTGMFEFNYRDERYLPFEGAGVISEWSLELPAEARQFDYNTISDVIITIRYTARDSANPNFKPDVKTKIKNTIAESIELLNNNEGLYRLLSLKNDFPDEFHRMKSDSSDVMLTKEIIIERSFFPYFTKGYNIEITDYSFYKKDGNKLGDNIMTRSPTLETNSEPFKLNINYDPGKLKDYDDVYLLINYSLKKNPSS